jgi:hypothetical protein
MDIQTSFNNQILQAMKTVVENNLNLTVGQQLVTKVIAINTTGITLKWGNQTLTVENQNSRAVFTPYVGQNATLQVVKTSPALEFKLLAFDAHSYETPPSPEKMSAMRLTLATAPLVSRLDESMKQFSTHAENQHPVSAKVVGLVGNKIQLELIVDDHRNTDSSGKKMLISIEKNQLQLLPSQAHEPLKVGQPLTLAITKIGAMPEFKQLPTVISPINAQEEKIAAFMKQLLPRHESPSVLLNELKTDLPRLDIKNENLSQTLKQNASALFEHLPPKEQLFNPQKLRHLIYSSGIFFDAKNSAPTTYANLKPPSPTQQSTPVQKIAAPVDLKMPLLNLLQHTSVSNEIKQLASTLLQNLLKKDTAPITPALTHAIEESEMELHTQLLPLSRSENIPQSLKTLAAQILPNLKAPLLDVKIAPIAPLEGENVSATDELVTSDFKSELLKLVQTLKQGIAQQNEFALTETQVKGLEHLQHKTENALAKVVLDQLHSVPKEDSGKQLWAFELPFLMNNQIETLKMEVQRDKANAAAETTAQTHWSVNLTLTPPKLGEVQCVISYQNGVVNTYFKNEKPQTTTLISSHLTNLKQQLQQVGLLTGLMSAHNNFQPIKSAYSAVNTSLLNETA